MHYGPVAARSDRLDGGVQHCVDEFSVWARADRPAHDHAIEAIDHGRQVYLAGGDLELRDVGEPLLVWRACACVHPAITVATVVALEDAGHGATHLDVLVRDL